jgi:hypothetical protein
MNPFLDPGTEKVLFPEYPGHTFTAKLNISVFPYESPNSPDAPGGVYGLEFNYPINQSLIIIKLCFFSASDGFGLQTCI